jgi:hypothetical protein
LSQEGANDEHDKGVKRGSVTAVSTSEKGGDVQRPSIEFRTARRLILYPCYEQEFNVG